MTIRVQAADFDIAAEYASLRKNAEFQNAGAVVIFTGLVRDYHKDGAIKSLTLEHYEGMTQRQLSRIRDDAMARFSLSSAVIIHRIGRLLPNDQIVFVGCAAPHRKAAFDGANYMMDFLKTDAPFWKSEERDDGKHWVSSRTSDDDAKSGW